MVGSLRGSIHVCFRLPCTCTCDSAPVRVLGAGAVIGIRAVGKVKRRCRKSGVEVAGFGEPGAYMVMRVDGRVWDVRSVLNGDEGFPHHGSRRESKSQACVHNKRRFSAGEGILEKLRFWIDALPFCGELCASG